jgi:hypothetical protein
VVVRRRLRARHHWVAGLLGDRSAPDPVP